MRRFFISLFALVLLASPAASSAQDASRAVDAAAAPPELAQAPTGDAPSTTFNETGVFEPRDLERIVMEVPREGTLYITFQRRFTVTGGSASKNVQMDFTFSSIVLRHSGVTPGNANLTLRMIDGRTVFVSVRSLPKVSEDRFAYIR